MNGTKYNSNPLTKRFIKGVFNTKPPKPRYTYTWDINKVSSCIAILDKNSISEASNPVTPNKCFTYNYNNVTFNTAYGSR